jgi:hypothetical protein
MSKTVILLSLVFFCACIHAQIVQDQTMQSLTAQQQFCKHKIERYTKTRNAGSVLLGTGLTASAVGLCALVSYFSEDQEYSSDGEITPDARYYVGLVGLELGIDMIIGGVILHSIGSHKVRQYSEKLSNLSLGVSLQPNSKGVALCYRF